MPASAAVPRASEALGAYDASIQSMLAITMGADVQMPRITRGIYVGGSGTLVVVCAGDAGSNEVTLTGLAAGVWHPMQIQWIVNSGTTATGIVAGF